MGEQVRAAKARRLCGVAHMGMKNHQQLQTAVLSNTLKRKTVQLTSGSIVGEIKLKEISVF